MARPKKSDTNEKATVRIENAFWKLLETERYSEITVMRICQESGTNRNSFYYHYRDIDDLAYTAFKNNANADVLEFLLSGLLSAFRETNEQPSLTLDQKVLPHSRKVMLCASSDSAFLNGLVRALLKQTWFEALSIDEARLSDVDNLQVDFIFSGLTTLLGRHDIRTDPLLMPELARSDIGKASIEALKRIAAGQKERGR